ncbi:MAG: single-strand DNA-binding protein [Parvicella sp.]|jgi:single-strand DNA-binding protein
MARSVNKVMLLGNLGKDPETRHLENGTTVTSFSIATSESYKDRTSGEIITQTDWHNIVLWRGLAEIADKYVKKGDKVFIEGKLRTRTWQDQEGNNRYTTEVIGDNMVMMGKNDNSGQNPQGGNTAQPAQPNTTTPTATSPPASESESDDDDLPF